VFYTIYKITNKINGKIYIGKHQTKDLNDGYMGSGKHLRRAITKYGIDNFKKEILFKFSNENEMNTKEAELVTEEFCLREDTYNLCPGGNGGFGYINSDGQIRNGFEHRIDAIKQTDEFLEWSKRGGEAYAHRLSYDVDFRKKVSEKTKLRNETYPNGFLGKKHDENTKQKMRKSKNKGSGNSQFGTVWITDGKNNKKIKKDVDNIPEGWYKGRILERCKRTVLEHK
jgi:hypothetical protein